MKAPRSTAALIAAASVGLLLSLTGSSLAETRAAPFGRPDPGPAYEVNWLADLPAIAVAGGIDLGIALSDAFPSPYCGVAQPCDKDALWSIDRPVAGRFEPRWSTMSDIVLYSVIGGSLATLFMDQHWKHALNDLMVLTEAVLVTTAIYSITALAARRPRPFMYGELASEERRAEPYSSLSFFSGHTATAFSVTTALFSTIHRRRPHSRLQWIVLGAGLTLSTAVGAGRIASGNHFPTDVLVAALVGSSIGLLIPALHRSPNRALSVISTGNGVGLKVTWN